MPCQLICPNLRCRKILSVPDEMRGKVVKCEQCQTSCRVPAVRANGSQATSDGQFKIAS